MWFLAEYNQHSICQEKTVEQYSYSHKKSFNCTGNYSMKYEKKNNCKAHGLLFNNCIKLQVKEMSL